MKLPDLEDKISSKASWTLKGLPLTRSVFPSGDTISTSTLYNPSFLGLKTILYVPFLLSTTLEETSEMDGEMIFQYKYKYTQSYLLNQGYRQLWRSKSNHGGEISFLSNPIQSPHLLLLKEFPSAQSSPLPLRWPMLQVLPLQIYFLSYFSAKLSL